MFLAPKRWATLRAKLISAWPGLLLAQGAPSCAAVIVDAPVPQREFRQRKPFTTPWARPDSPVSGKMVGSLNSATETIVFASFNLALQTSAHEYL